MNGNSSNSRFFHITACPSSSCDLITTEVTTNYITESSSTINLITLATSSLHTTTHVNGQTSTADQKSSAFHHTTLYSGSSLRLNLPETSVTQRCSSLYSQSNSVKHTTITFASNIQTSTLESISSLKTFSSSLLSLVSSSSLSLLSTPSPSSSYTLFQTTSHGFISFLTPSPTRKVESSSMFPSASTARPTDGIEIEIQSRHNVSDTVVIIFVQSSSLLFSG